MLFIVSDKYAHFQKQEPNKKDFVFVKYNFLKIFYILLMLRIDQTTFGFLREKKPMTLQKFAFQIQ